VADNDDSDVIGRRETSYTGPLARCRSLLLLVLDFALLHQSTCRQHCQSPYYLDLTSSKILHSKSTCQLYKRRTRPLQRACEKKENTSQPRCGQCAGTFPSCRRASCLRLFTIYSVTNLQTITHPQMSAQSQQIKENVLNHPYTQQASKFLSGQVSSLDAEVSPAQ